MIDYQTLVLHLSLIDGVGPVAVQQVRQLLSLYSVSDLYRFTASEFCQNGISLRMAQLLCAGLKNHAILDKEHDLIQKYGVCWTTLGCDDYPALLASIYAPPPVLYWFGSSPFSFQNSCAIVGSRNATSYGKAVTQSLVEDLVGADITIVSGGAFGIDITAHQKAIELNGKTIVVVGAGLLHPYPFVHKAIFEKIACSGGSILSIFSLNTKPNQSNFPARNRVISGLSQVCVVVQAAEKSGALITAHHALEQGRSIFVVPGSVFESGHKGCHILANQGAAIMVDTGDIIGSIGLQPAGSTNNKKKDIVQVKSPVLDDPLQNKIFELCSRESLTFDELIAKTELPLAAIQSALFQMQLADHITETLGGRWVVRT